MASLLKLEKMFNGMNLKEMPLHNVCEACIEGKHQRTSFLKDEAIRVSKLLNRCPTKALDSKPPPRSMDQYKA